MVSFELGEEIKKDVFFRLVTSVGQKNFWVLVRNRTSDLRIPCSDALPLGHRDSTVSEVYYEVQMTRVLHTAMINNVDSVMFLERVPRSWQDGKNIFLYFFTELKTYHLSYFYQ